MQDFYPRPPRGGRRYIKPHVAVSGKFLSPPSARRATPDGHGCAGADGFLSPPSARRATEDVRVSRQRRSISIPALREEGDLTCPHRSGAAHNFYPRPPRGGRRPASQWTRYGRGYFYPRPPRGGRHKLYHTTYFNHAFLSPPSARRATKTAHAVVPKYHDFYPRPPRGGRP